VSRACPALRPRTVYWPPRRCAPGARPRRSCP
jgi:hypothetical protein